MGELKKDLDLRNQQWELYWDFKASLDENKTDKQVVKQCLEVLENALNFLLTHKLVEREWTAILGDNGLLKDTQMKAEMAKGLGLLTNHHIRLIRQIGDIQKAFANGATSLEDELVKSIAVGFALPMDTYIPRKYADNDEAEGYIRWNPLANAKSTRGSFEFVMDYLYFDLLNRTTYFDAESPLSIEEVSLTTVLQEQEDRYLKFIGDIRQQEANLCLELKVARQTDEFLQGMVNDIIPPVQLVALHQKKEANQKEQERLQNELDEVTELKKNTTESWNNHQKNFAWIVEEAGKVNGEQKTISNASL